MNKFNCILYGESGVGKTPFAGTLECFEKTSPCLFLDIDMGSMSLDSMKPKPQVFEVEKWSQLTVIYDKLLKRDWENLSRYLSEQGGRDFPVLEYRSIVLDSGTELEYKLRSGIVGANEKGDGEVASQPDYLKTQERFRKMYRAFRNLPVSLVMTAGIRELKEESTGIVKRSPDFQPGLSHDLVRMTDFVFFMSTTMEGMGADAKWKRQLITSLSQRFVARSRSDVLPRIIEGEKFSWNSLGPKVLG